MLAHEEKKHRLALELYRGCVSVAFTACTRNRTTVFLKNIHVAPASQALIEAAGKRKCDVVICLFMPDHVHVVLKGLEEDSDTYRAMWLFKQKTGYLFSKEGMGKVWQKDFHDHIIRSEADLANHVRYILENPVRKGLVGSWKEYPYKGSTVYDLYRWDVE